MQVRVWTGVGKTGFVYPELRESEEEGGFPPLKKKDTFGICLSGGGFRATTLALGWVRVLHKHGILSQARYLSSNSGASWFNTAFSYQQKYTPETFLGDYIEPTGLTHTVVTTQGKAEGSYAKAIVDASFMSDLIYNLVEDLGNMDFWRKKDVTTVRAWSECVGKGFLEPFELDETDSAYCLFGREQLTQQVSHAKVVSTACREPGMPFPIIAGCIAAKGDHRQFHCFEFTPLYSGCPAAIEDSPGRK